jgi:CO dehydrogenase maturation factor
MPDRPCTIAVSGKGGTGKTTISALLIRSFIDLVEVPVLAIDADPNANLHEALRVIVHESLGSCGKKRLPVTFPGA